MIGSRSLVLAVVVISVHNSRDVIICNWTLCTRVVQHVPSGYPCDIASVNGEKDASTCQFVISGAFDLRRGVHMFMCVGMCRTRQWDQRSLSNCGLACWSPNQDV
eukprot:15483558-Alexandrium_andersonii.AAC.1